LAACFVCSSNETTFGLWNILDFSDARSKTISAGVYV
jgi:hypothetical protein